MPYSAEIKRATPSAFIFVIDQSGSMGRRNACKVARFNYVDPLPPGSGLGTHERPLHGSSSKSSTLAVFPVN